jgi:Terminase small subunit
MALTNLQRGFVREYLMDPERDGEQAAIRAGASPDRAKRTAEELLEKPEIQAAIEGTLREIMKPIELNTDSVLDGLVFNIKAARANGNDLWSLAEQRKTWELIGKHLGMFKDRLELGFDDKLIELLKSARARKALPKPEPQVIEAAVIEAPAVDVKPLTRGQVRQELRREEQSQSVEAWQKLTNSNLN